MRVELQAAWSCNFTAEGAQRAQRCTWGRSELPAPSEMHAQLIAPIQLLLGVASTGVTLDYLDYLDYPDGPTGPNGPRNSSLTEGRKKKRSYHHCRPTDHSASF